MERQDGDSLPARTFRALDTHNKGYLVKNEILSMIDVSGVYTHQSLADLIRTLEAKGDEDQITYQEFY